MPAGTVSNKKISDPIDGAPLMTDTQAVHARRIRKPSPAAILSIRTLAMPADTNQNGDIFGRWLLGQMDIGGGIFASKVAKSRTVTVAIEAMNFSQTGVRRRGLADPDQIGVHRNHIADEHRFAKNSSPRWRP